MMRAAATALATFQQADGEPSATSPAFADDDRQEERQLWEPEKTDPGLEAATETVSPPRMVTAPTVLETSRPARKDRLAVRPIAEWQGYVTRIEGDHFYAAMEGIFGNGVRGEAHEATIPIREVSPEDLPLLREGAYFRLAMVYSVTRGGTGTSRRTSTIVFRRLPAYRAVDLEQARESARELIRGIRLE